MKAFHCDHCHSPSFFENVKCLNCGFTLGYLPDFSVMSALEPADAEVWRASYAPAGGALYRQCGNGKQYEICNWLVPVGDPHQLCIACRLNGMIPELNVAGNLDRWHKLEMAKRRVIDTVIRLGLSVDGVPSENRPALRFMFLGTPAGGGAPLTGHVEGVITVNIAEADEDERERRRIQFREPYRTLVGHFRHEMAHYFWDQLILGTQRLEGFRKVFGDESANYGPVLNTYYLQGPPADWSSRFATAYASSHPWEDWAETWAHYLHMMDTIETAGAFGMELHSDNPNASATSVDLRQAVGADTTFGALMAQWPPLTCALNELNRGMGMSDLYPFALPSPAIEKLRFIHELIQQVRAARPDPPPVTQVSSSGLVPHGS